MIHHVVVWRLNDEAKGASWPVIVEQLERNMAAMRVSVPGLLRLELGVNRARVPDAADLMLYSEFESWPALKGYEAHPLHHELRELIAPLRIERRVVDYQT